MMSIRIWFLVASAWLLASTNPLVAQTEKYIDKVELTNGSVIWGFTELGQEQLKIFLDTDDSLAIPLENVRSLKTGKLNPDLYMDRVMGIYYQITAGVLTGKSYQFSDNDVTFSMAAISGYKFKRWWGLGLGAGLDYYPEQRHLPLFLDIQGDLISGRITPFYQINAGWSWAQERSEIPGQDRLEGGFYLKPSIGARWHFSRNSWHLQISFIRQESTAYYEPVDIGNGSNLTNIEERTLQRFGISTGITF